MSCKFQNLNLKWFNLYSCKLLETNWTKIRLEEMGFYDTQIQETTFVNLDFTLNEQLKLENINLLN